MPNAETSDAIDDHIVQLIATSLAFKADTSSTDTSQDANRTRKTNMDDWKNFYDTQIIPIRLEQYIMHATLLNEQQNLYSRNTTLTENQSTQLGMVDRILSDFNNKGYGSMREFQTIDYKINHKKQHITYILYTTLVSTIIFIMVGLTMMGLFDINITITVGSVLIVIYLLIILLNFKQNQVRRKYNWNKTYWKSPKSKKNKSDTCKFLGVF